MGLSSPVELLLGWVQLLAIVSHKHLSLVPSSQEHPLMSKAGEGSVDWQSNSTQFPETQDLILCLDPLGIQT